MPDEPSVPEIEGVQRYQLFQLLRLLEAHYAGSPLLGDRGPAREERIRLRPSTSLGFAATEVVAMAEQFQSHMPRRALITTNLPGVYGAGTPLPLSYAHQVLLEEEDYPQLRQFLDLFHHRVLSLWYRARKRHRHEQSFRPEGSDPLSIALLDLIGVPKGATAELLGTDPVRLLRYMGLFLVRTRPVRGLEVLLNEELGLDVSIEQCPTRWVTLGRDQWCRLSTDPQHRGALGRDIVIGSRRQDRMGELRLNLGPVSYATLLDLWPGAMLYRRLVALARFYLRQPLDLRLHVRVPASEMGRTQIGGTRPSRLGRPACAGQPKQDPVSFVIPVTLVMPPPGPPAKEV